MLKGYLKRKEGLSNASECSFQQEEAYFSEAALFVEIAEDGDIVSTRPRSVSLSVWEDLEEPKIKPDEFASTSYRAPRRPKQQKSNENKRSHQEEDLCEMIQLTDAQMAIVMTV